MYKLSPLIMFLSMLSFCQQSQLDKTFSLGCKEFALEGFDCIETGVENNKALTHHRVICWGLQTKKILSINAARTEILNLLERAVAVVNRDEANKKIFETFPISNSEVELTIYTGKKDWNYVSWVSNWGDLIGYFLNDPDGIVNPAICLGKETLTEAKNILASHPPYEKVITHTKYGLKKVTLELHGSWGFFIEREVIKQINSGDFIYYAEVDGKKHKLCVEGDRVVLESSRKPIVEEFVPISDKI